MMEKKEIQELLKKNKETRKRELKKVIDSRIPWQLQNEDYRFIKIRRKGEKKLELINGEWQETGIFNGKEPYVSTKDFKDVDINEKPWNWRRFNYKYNDEPFIRYLSEANSYGVICGYGGLIIVDYDDKNVMSKLFKKLNNKFPTMVVKTGSGKAHAYYRVKDLKTSLKKYVSNKNVLLEIRGEGGQCVAPSSIHPSGEFYKVLPSTSGSDIYVLNNIDQLINFIDPKMNEWYNLDNEEERKILYKRDNIDESLEKRAFEAQLWKNGLRTEHILTMYGISFSNPRKGNTDCPFHYSINKKCLSYTEYGWNCFHCNRSGNAFELVMQRDGLSIKETAYKISKFLGCDISDPYENPPENEYLDSLPEATIEDKIEHKKYIMSTTCTSGSSGSKITVNMFRNYAKELYNIHPYFFDENQLWWLWNNFKFSYEIVDEWDLLTKFDKLFPFAKSENSTIKNQLKEAMRKHGRINIPKKPPKTWIQFKDKIVDIENNEEFPF